MRPSNRPRGLRDLNPDLLFGFRRRRAPGSLRAMAAFLRAALRRLGEDRRTCCAELKSKLALAEKAVGIEAARRQATEKERDEARAQRGAMVQHVRRLTDQSAADAGKIGELLGERDDARKLAAKWEIEAQDLRDLATQEKARAHRLANEVQALSLKLEQAEKTARRVRAIAANAAAGMADGDLRPVLREIDAKLSPRPPADPDPRAGRPGPGADLLTWRCQCGAEGIAGSLKRCNYCGLYREPAAAPPPPPAAPAGQCSETRDGRRCTRAPGHEGDHSNHWTGLQWPAAPEVKVRTVVVERVPDMRGPRGPLQKWEPQIFAGHSGDMVDVEEAETVCSRCGRPLDGAFIRDPDLGGDLHFDCAREARKAAARRRA